ncbi:hypothetical protein [Streptomyces sp. NPDC056549]|uniref:hypothetical protein n=1 Tax=Streptomyces sp. NPDC056549 TaxID=3345864 RepID=UPI0036CB6469
MTITWPPRVMWRKHEDDAEPEATEETPADEPDEDDPKDLDVEPRDEHQDDEPEWHQLPPEVHHHHYYYAGPGTQPDTGQGAPLRAPVPPITRRSVRASWAALTPWQRFILRNAACAGAGAWGPGLFTGDWDAGLPQKVMVVMDSVAAGTNEATSPFIIGGLILLGSAMAGGIIVGFIDRCFARVLPAFCRLARFTVHIPVASAAVAVLLFTTAR